MTEDQELISELGIENLSEVEQGHVVDALTMKIGEALAAELSEKQLEEFQAIIDGDDDIINNWLAENEPDYKDNPAYEVFVDEGEGVPAEKMYAYTAWLGVNKPDFQDIVAEMKADIKANVDQYK